MALIGFPRAVPPRLTEGRESFLLRRMEELSPQRSGRTLAKDLGPALWTGEWTSVLLDEDELGAIRAWFDTLGSTERFLGYDDLRQYPRLYRNGWGALEVGGQPFDGACTLADVAENNVEIDLSDLPVGFQFSGGDYLAFDYGAATSRALHRVSAPATADGSGEATVEVRPHVRTGWEADATVALHEAAAHMLVDPGSYSESVDENRWATVSFRAIQTL